MFFLSNSYPLFSKHGWLNAWPSEAQLLLLKAALLPPDPARLAWQQWCAEHSLEEALDEPSFALMGLLYKRLAQLDRAAPRPVFNKLRGTHFYHWQRNQNTLLTLRELMPLLTSAGIDPMVHKGLPLLSLVYRDFGARITNDLDLLVRESQVDVVHRVLIDNGWVAEGNPDADFRSDYHAMTYRKEARAEIDLHWRPFMLDTPRQAEEEFWARAERRTLDDVSVLVPALSDLLMMVCFHGRKPMPTAVTRWVADAALLIHEIGDVDWAELQARAGRAKLAAPLQEAQMYLHREFKLCPAPVAVDVDRISWCGHILFHCYKKAMHPIAPESGIVDAAGVMRRAPYLMVLLGVTYWLSRRSLGFTTTPGLIVRRLFNVRRQGRLRRQRGYPETVSS